MRLLFFGLVSLWSMVTHAQQPDSIPALPQTITMPDSLVAQQLLQVDSVQRATSQKLDSLHTTYDSVQHSLTQAIGKLNHQKDSLTQLGLPTEGIDQRLDSVTLAANQKLTTLKTEAAAVKDKAVAKLETIAIHPEVDKVVKDYASKLQMADITLPAADFAMPGMDWPAMQSIPGLDLPELNLPGNTIALDKIGGEVALPQLNTELPTDLPTNVELPTQEQVAEQLEQRAKDAADLGNLPEAPTMPTEEQTKEQVMTQARKAAVDHFAGKQEQLKAAMDKMSKYKQKYSSVQSIKDLPKRPPNPMKEKKFVERLVPGVALQVFRQNDWKLDVAPYVGYRFTGRLTVGMGWNERITFTSDELMRKKLRVYGPRFYSEYMAFKGFSGRVEVETMNAFVRESIQTPDAGKREWVPAVLAGLKKDYRITKSLRGTALLLYNFYNPDFKSPYGDRLNVRFGFEYRIKVKRKS